MDPENVPGYRGRDPSTKTLGSPKVFCFPHEAANTTVDPKGVPPEAGSNLVRCLYLPITDQSLPPSCDITVGRLSFLELPFSAGTERLDAPSWTWGCGRVLSIVP
jgi:hypothetical protein